MFFNVKHQNHSNTERTGDVLKMDSWNMKTFPVLSPDTPEAVTWALHTQPPWHRGEEQPPDPARHGVSR